MSLGFFIAYDFMVSGPFLDQGHKSSQSSPPSARHPYPPPKTFIENRLRRSPEPLNEEVTKEGNTPSPRIQPTFLPEPLRGQVGTINNPAIHIAIEVTRYARRLQVTPHLLPRRLRLMER